MPRPTRRNLAGALLVAGLWAGVTAARAQALPAAPPQEVTEVPDGQEDAAEPVEDRVPRLIGEADALAGGGVASSGEVKELMRLMRELKEALEKKTALIETGKPTEEVDAELEAAAAALDASSAEIAARAESMPDPAAAPPKEGAVAALAGVLEEAARVLERLNGVRSARNGTEDEEAAGTGGDAADPEPVEESDAEVTGSVTEDGRPVAGATVADAETGATAITDASGLFELPGVSAGRLVTLSATKAGRPLGVRRVLLAPGRSVLADFGGAPSASGAAGGLGLRPSIMRIGIKGGQATGLILGEVRDARGRPAAGAAVALEHLGVVRTDVRGRFAFLGVPAGPHGVAVRLRGHQPRRQGVRVDAKRRADLQVRMSLAPRRAPTPAAWHGAGAASRVGGIVVDPAGRPVVGARIRLVRGARALSVVSRAAGRYAIRDVDAGPYRVIVSKVGYRTAAQTVALGVRESVTLNLRLVARTGVVEPPRLPVARRPQAGALHGRVVDGRTGRPVAGARVHLAGQAAVADATGAFRLPHLDPGSHRLVVEAAGFAGGERVVVVEAARDVALTLPLTPLRPSRAVPRRERR